MSFAIFRMVCDGALVLTITRAFLGVLWWWETRHGSYPSAKPWLHAGYAMLAASVAFPVAMLLVAADLLFLAPFELGNHPNTGILQFGLRSDGIVTNPVTGKALAFEGFDVSWTDRVALAVGIIAVFGCARLLVKTALLARACRAAKTWKKVGVVRIAIWPVAMVPFCAWTPQGLVVVVPPDALDDRSRLRMIVAHEFAHIRSKHLHASWLLAFLQALTPWNPVVRWWQRWIARTQEIACDQSVLARKSIDRISYGRCLLWAAQGAPATESRMLALPMSAGSPSALKGRITMILTGQTQIRNRAPLVAICGSLLAALVAFGAQGFAADRRLSLREAQEIADRRLAPFGVHVTVDEMALDGLNRIVTGGRSSFRRYVRRLNAYRALAEPALAKYGVPEPLLGIALAESGVGAGIPQEEDAPWPGDEGPRGIWQMTAATAREMGLRVDAVADERFNRSREVDAVARLLALLHSRLGDWSLAIAAYNMGPEAVESAVKIGGSTDPNALRKKGLLNGYFSATVVPTMLVAQEPELVLAGGTFDVGSSAAFVRPARFEVRTEITSPTGEDWGRADISAALETSVTKDFQGGERKLSLSVTVHQVASEGCHPVDLQLVYTPQGASEKHETKMKILACEGAAVVFDGKRLGGPSMRISLKKYGQ